ncbi:MAG: hypothetical protein GY839_17375 [candidate division Zixibacteria bacterium]|nr:hypothetical protein [candidate division Zixibacteria bacterium]
MNRFSVVILICFAFGTVSPVQAISLEEILNRTRQALETEKKHNADLVIEHTERFINGKVNDKGEYEKVDTVMAVVSKQGDTELNRETIYATCAEERKRRKDRSLWEMLDDMTVDSPNYVYELFEITDNEFVVAIAPRMEKPDKGLIDGKYYIDKESYLINKMDFMVPRPEKLNELAMRFRFEKLDNGLYVTETMYMLGRVKVLFGIVDIRMKVKGEFFDYKVLESDE